MRISNIFAAKTALMEKFLESLRSFRFTGDIWAVPGGNSNFPR